MMIYRGIQEDYINPENFKDSRKALDNKFREIEKFDYMNSGDVTDFCNWYKLKQAKRLGHFGTNRENILKHASPKGNLLVLNIPLEELMDYVDFKTIGDAGVQKEYGDCFFLPDDAPYTPNVFKISEYPLMLKTASEK